eukprot:Skav229694  [mRNA]  locus=scaffold3722:198158:199606:+ [translate_table: standard]
MQVIREKLAPQHAAMAYAFANGYAMGRVTLMWCVFLENFALTLLGSTLAKLVADMPTSSRSSLADPPTKILADHESMSWKPP